MATKSVSKAKAEERAPVPAGGDWFTERFLDLRHQMDELFDSMSRGWHFPTPFGLPTLGEGGIAVRFDVSESDEGYEVTAELPGLDEKDVEVTVSEGLVTIKGEKKAEKEEKKKDTYVSERSYGSFRRTFRLPEPIDENKAKAKFEKGVLRVTLPKAPEAKKKAKKIAIAKG